MIKSVYKFIMNLFFKTRYGKRCRVQVYNINKKGVKLTKKQQEKLVEDAIKDLNTL